MIINRIETEGEEIITSNEIKLILDRYRIGKKPLAKLLGWGETTIIRYMDGDMPTNEYSNKLKIILSDPEYYYKLLMKRQDCLTGVAYKKSRRAVLGRIMASKIYAIAYHIVNKSNGDISPGYIQYLLYYVQAFSLAFYDKEIFQEDYSINNEQAPYLKIYNSMKHCGVHTLELSEDYLTKEEMELVDAVYEGFSWFGLKSLNAMHISEKALLKTSRDKYGNRIIPKESIQSYFKEVLINHRIHSISSLVNYPEDKLMAIRKVNLLA